MRNSSLKSIFLVLLIVMLSISLFTAPIAGGDWAVPDGDWGGDWGGSDDWNDSGSWGSSWDSDDSWGSSSSGGGISFSFTSAFPVIAFLFIFYIIMKLFMSNKKAGTSGSASSRSYTQGSIQMSDTSAVNRQSIELLREKDPDFSEAVMLSKAENLFMTMQLAWAQQEYEPLRPFLSNALYEQHAKQLADKIARDEKNVSSQIAVLHSKLESYSTDGHTDYLNIWLRVKMKDHIVQKSNPSKVISGNPDRIYFFDFRWQFTRTAGAKTIAATDGVNTGECPNCGANINMNQSGKCDYCGSVISTTEYDWVLSKIDGLQQRSR